MNRFRHLSVFLETSSGVTPTVSSVKRFIKIISGFGYDRLYLGMADAYKIDGEPYFGYKRGGYSKSDFAEMDAYAKSKKVELIPQIQILGHLHYLKKYRVYRELFDTEDTLIVGDEKVYSLIDKMIGAVSEGLSSRTIHIGLDETFGLGTGNYLKKFPPADKKELILRHIGKVNEILKKYGYSSVELWGDMLLNEEGSSLSLSDISDRLPENFSVIVWNYEETDERKLSEMLDRGKSVTDKTGYAGGVWKYLGFGPNNAFSSECLLSQMKTCHKKGIEHFMITLWSDNVAPCSAFAALPSLFVAAQYAKGEIEDVSDIDKAKFAETAGIGYEDMYSLEYIDNPYEEQSKERSSSSVWGLYSDILLGNFDVLIPEGAENIYLNLAERYERLSVGKFGYIFRMSASLMKVLAEKARIPARIRSAYREKDKSAILKIAAEIKTLKRLLKDFLRKFEAYFLHDNMAFGLEVYHLRIGELIARCDYAVSRLNAFAARGEKIDELEGGILPPECHPSLTIGRGVMIDPKFLISYCI